MDFVIRASERTFNDHGEIVSQDLIHKVTMTINDGSSNWPVFEFNRLFEPDDENNIHIKFNLLCTKDADYDLRMQFYCTNGQTYYKHLRFTVVDTRRVGLTVYKLKPIPASSTIEALTAVGGREAGNHIFSHYCLEQTQSFYTQYLPESAYKVKYIATRPDGPGARLSHMLVIKGTFNVPVRNESNEIVDWLTVDLKEYLQNSSGLLRQIFEELFDEYDEFGNITNYANYDVYTRHDWVETTPDPSDPEHTVVEIDGDTVKYYIFVSREFDHQFDPDGYGWVGELLGLTENEPDPKDRKIILRDEYIYVPQKHYLCPLDNGKAINDYKPDDFKIYRDETACVVPDIKFLKHIDSYEWVFHNASTLEDINVNSIKEPIVAEDKRIPLPAGYYDIIFRYKLANDPEGRVNEVSLKSAFIQSDEYRT